MTVGWDIALASLSVLMEGVRALLSFLLPALEGTLDRGLVGELSRDLHLGSYTT